MLATRFEQSTRGQSGTLPSGADCGLARFGLSKAGPGHAGLIVALALVVSACGGGGDAVSSTVQSTPAAGTPAAAPAATPAPSPSAAPAPSPSSAPVPGPSAAPAPAPASSAWIAEALQRINDARAVARSCGSTVYAGTGPLQWNSMTEDAARTQAVYLQTNNLFSHTGANGSTVGDRLTATGYRWNAVGENIAAGYADLAAVMAGWLSSPGHCANIMNPAFVDVGVALQPGTSGNTYSTYWGMVLAKP